MDLITLLVGVLATARITRLVTTDRITQAPRMWMLTRVDADGMWGYLIHCTWCVSVYAGAAVAAVLAFGPGWSVWVLGALSFSYTAGWLASKEGE